MTPSLADLMGDWAKQYDGWFIRHTPVLGCHALFYINDQFSSVAVYFWDDKALDPSKHLAELVSETKSTYDFHVADPEFFPKIREVMDSVERKMNGKEAGVISIMKND